VCWLSTTLYGRDRIHRFGDEISLLAVTNGILFMPHLKITYTVEKHWMHHDIYVWKLSFPTPKDENYERDAVE
jgi:hypothetical protein